MSTPPSPHSTDPLKPMTPYPTQGVWDRWLDVHMQDCIGQLNADVGNGELAASDLKYLSNKFHRLAQYNHELARFIEQVDALSDLGLLLLHNARASSVARPSKSELVMGGHHRAHEHDGLVGWIFGWDPMTGREGGRNAEGNYSLLQDALRVIPGHLVRMSVVGFGLRNPEIFDVWQYPRLDYTDGRLIELGAVYGAVLQELVFVDSARALSYILPRLTFGTQRTPPVSRISLFILDNDRTFPVRYFFRLLAWITGPDSVLYPCMRKLGAWRRGNVLCSDDLYFAVGATFVLEVYIPQSATEPSSRSRIDFVVYFQALDQSRQTRFKEMLERLIPPPV
ncbi:hypothetical protein PENSPDRAFT_749358 [Peniophora sp. CONT]|nr:hypothetical protein PENSPDRAFT_749358 [Peniophora sp. CONT]